ncbi:MAG: ECF transporter S component [Candidatus Thorarchaeota archaeon]|nr:ECF transporter S component [Candidatus Thorarchaeota archaeon]
MMHEAEEHFLGTREIATIAILGALGGSLSTFVGYLGNLVNLALGVPFGAGQFMAGLHVFWLVLMRLIASKRGVGTFGGTLKGLVELFAGSTHGVVIVLVSFVQGIIIDLAAEEGGPPQEAGARNQIVWWFVAGLSSASNVIVFQIVYFSGAPWIYLAAITALAFSSGAIFGGYFAWQTMFFIQDIGMTGFSVETPSLPESPVYRNIPAILFIIFLTTGALYYTIFVAKPFADPYACEITGDVANPFIYHPSDFIQQEVTIAAELQGAYTYIPPKNYTGVPLNILIERAEPSTEASTVRVEAKDGYSVEFGLSAVLSDDRLILTEEEDSGLWLIAAEYEGSYWVHKVSTILVT